MTDFADLVRAFDIQANACVAFGSPFSGALLKRAKDEIAPGTGLAQLLSPFKGMNARALMGDAVPLRWLGCLHDLALSGDAPALTAAFPAADRPGDVDASWTAALARMAADPARFAGFMAHEPQTNEVRRSTCLLPMFLTVAAQTGLPLRLFEIGASAGLNQLWDRYAYDYGSGMTWGDTGAAVRLDAAWTGSPPPLGAGVHVVSRAACDRKPVDIRDPVARRRLKSYVWADQFERLARLDGAIATALAANTRVEAEDAVTWTARRARPEPGAATVLFHSVFWQYMPDESQTALSAVIADLGRQATAEAPFAWLRMEPAPRNLATLELRLTMWPGGEERLMGIGHAHGASVDWS